MVSGTFIGWLLREQSLLGGLIGESDSQLISTRALSQVHGVSAALVPRKYTTFKGSVTHCAVDLAQYDAQQGLGSRGNTHMHLKGADHMHT